MAQEEAKPIGPDLSLGIPLDQPADGKMLVGHVGDEDVGARRFRGRGALHALSWSARRRSRGRRYGAVPMASRLFRSAHGRGPRSASPEPDRVLDSRTTRREDLGQREARTKATKAAR